MRSRMAIEREKPDAERLLGYQDRDIVNIGDQFQQVGRSMYRPAERDVLVVVLQHASKLPENHRIAPFDALVHRHAPAEIRANASRDLRVQCPRIAARDLDTGQLA